MTWQLSAFVAFILAFIGAVIVVWRMRKRDADDGAAQQREVDQEADDAIVEKVKAKRDALDKLTRDALLERARKRVQPDGLVRPSDGEDGW